MEDDDQHKNLNSVERVFIAMHDGMMKLYAEGKHMEWIGIAETLLTKANLPILIRARCHAMLSRRINNPFSVQRAERAVEILDVKVRGMVSAEVFPEGDLEEAQGLLGLAKEQSAAAEGCHKPASPVEDGEGEGQAGDQGERVLAEF
ncbi:hypothetical protein LTR91_000354 [Friedmanniomyces endolithicus]|uniref:Uncharacterized protein n=1 Tax=Friedmanniomyces endolithicus TaxID=329885 RepID=A0A4U0VIH3_9PEZI|nr:hypothetical protein LTS09_016339 [Friedmanniomyces endolithicus]KAK0277186.1 hypothetical protein LTR35_010096 [Friedmanniomyces endolithicus]KAK0298314.1 hypothetical protein LTS00_003279 [Friedmanniomyces endolithicus]KAK0313738.1 hypothetical protein LTR01_001995 [Friedmanniomyces endolithicus]KAK0323804.1 hypothetical protein LTR82_004924 [Friedmanniomyces endolithicus]